jgi:hypothetical protein
MELRAKDEGAVSTYARFAHFARRIDRIPAVEPITANVGSLEALLGVLPPGVDAAVGGDPGAPSSNAAMYRSISRALATSGMPTDRVPRGRGAPMRPYLLGSHTTEIALPQLHGIHETVAVLHGPVAFAGVGAVIMESPQSTRMEDARRRSRGREAEERLKAVGGPKDDAKALPFTTPRAHTGLGTSAGGVLAELIRVHNPGVGGVGADRSYARK